MTTYRETNQSVQLAAVMSVMLSCCCPAQIAPSTSDLWDVSQGVIVLDYSALHPGSGVPHAYDAYDLFGGHFGKQSEEPERVVFADNTPANHVHFVEWKTRAPVTVKSFNLFAWGDPSGREFSKFTLKTKTAGSSTFDLILHSFVPSHPYQYVQPDNGLLITAGITPVRAQEFRAEFAILAGQVAAGPRVLEIDGFDTESPVTVVAGPVINPANGHEYYLLSPSSWTVAEERAVQLGGHLVTVNDELERLWVYSTFALRGGQPKTLWTGLTDRDQEGVFKWVSGEPLMFTAWGSGEPNNVNGMEHFVELFGPTHPLAGQWNDEVDAKLNYGVVEVANVRVEIQVSAVAISWNSAKDAFYQPEFATVEQPSAWLKFGEPIKGTGERMTLNESVSGNTGRLFRVVRISSATP